MYRTLDSRNVVFLDGRFLKIVNGVSGISKNAFNMLNLFRKKVTINEELLAKKLKMAEKILAHEMPARKEQAYLTFIKGMVELTKKEERIFDKRLAEMKEMRKKPSDSKCENIEINLLSSLGRIGCFYGYSTLRKGKIG